VTGLESLLGRGEIYVLLIGGILKARDNLENLSVDGRIISK
jgi:hypothetical protein